MTSMNLADTTYTLSVSSVLLSPVKPSHIFIILYCLQSDFTYIITLGPKKNAVKWAWKIFANIHGSRMWLGSIINMMAISVSFQVRNEGRMRSWLSTSATGSHSWTKRWFHRKKKSAFSGIFISIPKSPLGFSNNSPQFQEHKYRASPPCTGFQTAWFGSLPR